MITTSRTKFLRYRIIKDDSENYYLVDIYNKPLVSLFSVARWLKELKVYSITAEQCQMVEKHEKPQKQLAVSSIFIGGISVLLYRILKPYLDLIHYDASKMFYAILAIILTVACIIPIIYLYKRDEKNLSKIIELGEPKYIKLSYSDMLDIPTRQELKKYRRNTPLLEIILIFSSFIAFIGTIQEQHLLMGICYVGITLLTIFMSSYIMPPQPITKINIIDKGDK